MYNPSRFQGTDSDVEEIVGAHSFATLISVDEQGGHLISHLPLLLEKRGEDWILLGHMARANAHWKSLEGGESTAVFHGPHSYITPLWYEQCDVPTWNYVVAHLSGTATLIESEERTVEILLALSRKTEGPQGWKFEIPPDLAAPGVLLKSIVAFEMKVKSRAAKLKLSQNKSSTDFQGVMQGLSGREDYQSRAVWGWMQRLAKRFR